MPNDMNDESKRQLADLVLALGMTVYYLEKTLKPYEAEASRTSEGMADIAQTVGPRTRASTLWEKLAPKLGLTPVPPFDQRADGEERSLGEKLAGEDSDD